MTNYITSNGVQAFSMTIASGSTTSTATISAVGSGAIVILNGINPSTSANPSLDFVGLTLTNSTTITATRKTGTSGTVVVKGCVVDADTSNFVSSVQYGTISISSGSSSSTATINSTTNPAYYLLGTNSANTTTSMTNEEVRLDLSGTTLTATRAGTTGALVVYFGVVDFQSGCLAQSIQYISASSSTSVTSYTATVTSCVPANSVTFYAGQTIATASTNLATSLQRGALSASTTFTVSVNTAVAYAKRYNACLVSFNSGVLNSSVQRGTTTLTGVVSNTTTLGTNVVEANSALLSLGNTSTSTSAVLDRALASGFLTLSSSGSIPTVVQTNFLIFSDTTSADPYLNLTASGNLIVIGLTFTVDPGTISITDNMSQTYTQITDATSTTTSGIIVKIFYKQNTSANMETFTISWSNSCSVYCSIYEVSGIPTSGVIVDAAVSANNLASLTPSSGSIITTQAYDFIFTAIGFSAITYVNSVSSPFSTLDTSFKLSAHHIPDTTVDEVCTWNLKSNDYGVCISAVAFKSTYSVGTDSVVKITKKTATANVTASWEVVEWPEYVAGGSNNYSDSINESAHPVYSFSTAVVVEQTTNASVSSSYTVTGGIAYTNSISDSTTQNYSVSSHATINSSVTASSSLGFSPLVSAILNAVISNSVVASSQNNALLSVNQNLSESKTLAGSISASLGIERSTVEAIISSATILARNEISEETLYSNTLHGETYPRLDISKSTNESLNTSSDLTGGLAVTKDVSENITTTYAQQNEAKFNAPIYENFTTSESTLASATFNISISNRVTTLDSLSVGLNAIASVLSSISTGDTLSALMSVSAAMTNGVTVLMSVDTSGASSFNFYISESVGVGSTENENLSVSEHPVIQASLNHINSAATSTTDSLREESTLNEILVGKSRTTVSIDNGVSVSDFKSEAFTFTISTRENLTPSESFMAVAKFSESLVSSISSSESLTSHLGFSFTIDEIISLLFSLTEFGNVVRGCASVSDISQFDVVVSDEKKYVCLASDGKYNDSCDVDDDQNEAQISMSDSTLFECEVYDEGYN